MIKGKRNKNAIENQRIKLNETARDDGKESLDKKINHANESSFQNKRTDKRFFYGPSTKRTIELQKNRYAKNISMVHESRSGGNDTKRFKKATASPLFTVTYRHYSLK